MQIHRVRPGSPEPLGASWDGAGTNFALYSETATGVELCLFDADGAETRIPIDRQTDYVWHAHVEGVGPGQRYGYRVSGPWKPEQGLRFNPNCVLLDPYARALDGTERWDRGAFAYDLDSPDKDLAQAKSEQRGAPLGVVIDDAFDWGDDGPVNTPLRRSVIYEAHVRGLTQRHPQVPPDLRGTYLGMASEPIVRHLKELGITAVELMPVHAFADDKTLLDRGLRNYWGYNSIDFFAPDVRYRAGADMGAEVVQFKQMIRALHAAGIEVILDVVYNHTAEGNQLGPTFNLKGIDNPTYYRLADDRRYYLDYTGTGSTLNTRHPQTLRLVMDSLRYWAREMRVDGFRFDLAATLARGKDEVEELSSFFTVIRQDPLINARKLIAEPWDVGSGGYQVGRFPLRWAEWNGRYRDTVRAYWKGDGGRAADLGYRLTGSSDLYQPGGRSPASSVNFITCHDGFTLRDLVSYNEKHNVGNGEGNRDGSDNNLSWNCGAEGDTDDPGVSALRRRQVRNLLSTLFLSQGIPMLSAGDEVGRTQKGNNNAYCQDNELTWLDWSFLADEKDPRHALLEFTRGLVRLRREHPLVQRATFFEGREIRGTGVRDIAWFRHDGQSMSDQDWSNPATKSLGLFMAGSGLEPFDEEGRAQIDDDLLILLNASELDLDFTLPPFVKRGRAPAWARILDTGPDGDARVSLDTSGEQVSPGKATRVPQRSLKVFGRRALGPGGLEAAYGVPTSTYRLQLRAGFGFREAGALAAYLRDLGVGGVYSSPMLKAQRGSTHGYDITDHAKLNPELGSFEDYRAFTAALRDGGLRHVMDFVPNHVGIGSGENAWWTDVLESGPSSLYAEFFDVEWHPPAATLQGKILLPVLGRQFGQEVEEGQIGLRREGGRIWVTYGDRVFPAAPRTYAEPLQRARAELSLARNDASLQELESILAALAHLPPPTTQDRRKRQERSREKQVIQRRLLALCNRSEPVAQAIDRALEVIARNADQLEAFLQQQCYRLSYWRVATEEINYRRFFDVNELAAIRMEEPEVFNAAHRLVFDLIQQGDVTGLRLDHTDGLYDPEGYLLALQAGAREARERAGQTVEEPMYAVAEKICAQEEELPRSWAVAGTTGYDFLGLLNAVLVDPAAEAHFTRFYAELTGGPVDYAALVYDAKRFVMEGSFSSEIHVLGHALKRIADADRRARDFTLPSLIRAIKEVVAAFPVYRTYVRPDGTRQQNDEAYIRGAVALAKHRSATVDGSVFDFLADVLLLRNQQPAAVDFAMKFQQLTGPIMAKGVEDTAFYRFNRFVALNEVGGNPARFGRTVRELHEHNAEMLSRWPLTMTAASTHDTKRSEDARARLAVLSEIPEEWTQFVREIDKDLRARLREAAPKEAAGSEPAAEVEAADAYAFYQALVAVFPLGKLEASGVAALGDRLAAYMQKAVHEAKQRSSWTSPDAAYDAAVERMVRAALETDEVRSKVADLVGRLGTFGAANSLSQVAVRLASPGVPDVYQGCETWSFALVDPDNRRPVDHARLAAMLEGLKGRPASTQLARDLLEHFEDGRVKLFATSTALRLRRELPALFLEGTYDPILASGVASEHVIAFERRFEKTRLVCVAPRFARKLTGGKARWPLGEVWGNQEIALKGPAKLQNVFTGERHEGASLRLAKVLETFPVAWLLENV